MLREATCLGVSCVVYLNLSVPCVSVAQGGKPWKLLKFVMLYVFLFYFLCCLFELVSTLCQGRQPWKLLKFVMLYVFVFYIGVLFPPGWFVDSVIRSCFSPVLCDSVT